MSCNLGLLVEASSKLSDDDEDDCEMEMDEMRQGDKENVIPEHPVMSMPMCPPPNNPIAAIATVEQGENIVSNSHICTSTSGNASAMMKKMNYRHVLYCKARGMPMDHVGNNAILQFDKGYEGMHSAELKCSHKACAKDGVKFRWCAHCKKAVAKRNFRKRHAHPELADVQIPSFSSYPSNIHPQYQNHSFYNPNITCTANSIMQQQRPLPACDLNSATDGKKMNNQHENSKTAAHYNSVPNAWIELYHSRPSGGSLQQQQEWLQNVIKEAGLRTESSSDQTNIKHEEADPTTEMNITATADPVIQATKEEFSGTVPPRFVAFDTSTQQDVGARYRQHAQALSLHVNTDLDTVGSTTGSAAMMLDSDGSFKIFSCTPRSIGSTYDL